MHACFYACITLLLYIVFVLYVCCVALYCQNMFGCLFVLLLYTVTVNLYIHVGLLKIANVNVLLLNVCIYTNKYSIKQASLLLEHFIN